jgi:hypothetical protein
MTDLVHWRHQPCGVQDKHEPHAYWTIDGTRVCEGVNEWQAAAFALERLGLAIRALLLPSMEQACEALVRFDRAMRKALKRDDEAGR